MKDRRMVPLADLEEAQAKIGRLQHEIDVQCSSEYVERLLKTNERLQATVEHLQDQCKEKHDSMIAMMNEALGLRAALEEITEMPTEEPDDAGNMKYVALVALDKLKEALHEKDKD